MQSLKIETEDLIKKAVKELSASTMGEADKKNNKRS